MWNGQPENELVFQIFLDEDGGDSLPGERRVHKVYCVYARAKKKKFRFRFVLFFLHDHLANCLTFATVCSQEVIATLLDCPTKQDHIPSRHTSSRGRNPLLTHVLGPSDRSERRRHSHRDAGRPSAIGNDLPTVAPIRCAKIALQKSRPVSIRIG